MLLLDPERFALLRSVVVDFFILVVSLALISAILLQGFHELFRARYNKYVLQEWLKHRRLTLEVGEFCAAMGGSGTAALPLPYWQLTGQIAAALSHSAFFAEHLFYVIWPGDILPWIPTHYFAENVRNALASGQILARYLDKITIEEAVQGINCELIVVAHSLGCSPYRSTVCRRRPSCHAPLPLLDLYTLCGASVPRSANDRSQRFNDHSEGHGGDEEHPKHRYARHGPHDSRLSAPAVTYTRAIPQQPALSNFSIRSARISKTCSNWWRFQTGDLKFLL